MKKIMENFKNPESIYRSAPFWSLNDKLTPEEMCFQLDKMKEGGFGGGFMHSRIGLITPYLSEEWMKCIKATVKHAEKEGLKAYLYDEDRWPSGFAGGIVNRKKKNWAMCITLYKKGNEWKAEIGYGAKTEWFNGYPYVSLMKKEAVKDFINSTYEVYKKAIGRYIPEVVPAIFTDEPNYFHSRIIRKKEAVVLPWVENFEKIFRKKYGYDIMEKLEYLVEERKGFEKVRYDFYKLLTELFVENFSKQIYQWCEENKIALTGHYLSEDTVEGQIAVIGDAMAHYEYMQWPGVDHLGRNIRFPLTLKQCSSVANQLGKERVLSELYGCSGQNFTFYERKWIGDWHLTLGINFFCPHLYLYSLRGCRKRDYPPTISHHQPYWKFNHLIEDYFARLNYILTQGKFKANILVIHPIESGWTLFKSEKIKKLDKFLSSLTEKLLEEKFEYEFGSESLIEKYGKVEKGKFKIGNCEYEHIIIPFATTLRRKTVELLSEFKGNIFAYSKFPYLVEGENSTEIMKLKRKCIIYTSVENLIELLNRKVKKDVEIKGIPSKKVSSIYFHRREVENSEVLFFTNTSLKDEIEVKVKLNFKGKVGKLNPFDGTSEVLPVEEKKDGIEFYLEFPPVGSNLILIEKNKSVVKGRIRKLIKVKERKLDGWNIKINDENVLVLDFCKYRIKGMKNWSRKTQVIELQNILE
ncbi:glycoside hydrolase, partial [bacterium]|nr:glycoside hydrolase [bacterium]